MDTKPEPEEKTRAAKLLKSRKEAEHKKLKARAEKFAKQIERDGDAKISTR